MKQNEKQKPTPTDHLLELLQVFRVLYDTGRYSVTESAIVGTARRLRMNLIKRGKHVKITAQNFPMYFNIKTNPDGIRIYSLRPLGISVMYKSTKDIIKFIPRELIRVKGNPRTGSILSLRGIYIIGEIKDTLAPLFQTDVMLLDEKGRETERFNEIHETIGHIRCLWKQCRARGEEVNFTDQESMKRALEWPHLRWIISYLVANPDDALTTTQNAVKKLILAILYNAEKIFGEENVERIKIKVAATSGGEIEMLKINTIYGEAIICPYHVSTQCTHVRLIKQALQKQKTKKGYLM